MQSIRADQTKDACACPKCGRGRGVHVYGETSTGLTNMPGVFLKGGFWALYKCAECSHNWTIRGDLPPLNGI